MSEKRFCTTIAGSCGKAHIALPFNPDEEWGRRARHDLTGSIGGHAYRGKVQVTETGTILSLGPAWRRDNGVAIGDDVEVVLRPEGPQVSEMEPDIPAAFEADPKARAAFEGSRTHCRKNHLRWIGEARRPETRARRIAEMMAMLRKSDEERGGQA